MKWLQARRGLGFVWRGAGLPVARAGGRAGAWLTQPPDDRHRASLPPCHAQAAAASSGRLLGAVVLERLPVVFPYPPEWELEYAAWREGLHAKQYKVLPKEFTEPKQSELGDSATRWQPADRVTAADREGDRRALRRRLDQILFLLVRPRRAGSGAAAADGWVFPAAENQAGESMRATAERALAEALTEDAGVQPFFVGNAPTGHHAPAAAPAAATGAGGGETLFFHRCQLIRGTPALRAGGAWGDHAWVAKDELGEYVKDPALLELLQKML